MNPALVDETANIRDAAKKIVWGAMAWGGQWCTSPGYAYVHESVADAFVAEAKKALVELFGDDPKSTTVIFIHRSALTITGETAVFEDIGKPQELGVLLLTARHRGHGAGVEILRDKLEQHFGRCR
jgi:Aldehyde dehydrogenase family